MRENDCYYILALNKVRFGTLFEKAGPWLEENKMMKQGDFCVFYSEETKEHAMFYGSLGKKQNLKLKGVLTDAFDYITCERSL